MQPKKAETKSKETAIKDKVEDEEKECFVIMPIGETDQYPAGHFKRVYEDIFKVAIKDAGFKAYRADDSNSSNLIQIEIIRRIIEAPMAICDLSMRNPNVLYELGIRQAFNKPVVLVQEVGTERIFDINSINTYDYRKERVYNQVLEDQFKICLMIKDTFEKHNSGEGVNSLLGMMQMSPAKIANGDMGSDQIMKVLFSEVLGIKNQLNQLNQIRNYNTVLEEVVSPRNSINARVKLNNIYKQFEKLRDCPNDEDNYLSELMTLKSSILVLKANFGLSELSRQDIERLKYIERSINEKLENTTEIAITRNEFID